MKPTITLIAPGAMGASIGARLVANGIEVRTLLDGRSAATIERANNAGMIGADWDALCDVDIILSIVPPNAAMLLVEKMAKMLGSMEKPPIFVDCNAVNSESAKEMAKVMDEAGCPFVDGGIIGGPAREGYQGPTLYVAGERADEIAVLNDFGLFISILDGPVGAASALKMAYAGMTKGLIAICSTMVLAADQAGVSEVLREEMMKSQPAMFASLGRSTQVCFSKAGRWVPEMLEISEFASVLAADDQIYKGFSAHYQRMAEDFNGDGKKGEILKTFFSKP